MGDIGSGGISKLLAAEQEAQEIVNKARKSARPAHGRRGMNRRLDPSPGAAGAEQGSGRTPRGWRRNGAAASPASRRAVGGVDAQSRVACRPRHTSHGL